MIFFFYCPFRVGVKRQIRKASSMGWNSCVLSDSRVSPVSVNGEFIFKLPEILPRLQDSILPHYKREGRPDLFLSSRIPGGRLRHHFWLWGTCVAFISINGSTSHRKNTLRVFKCLNDDLHKAGRAFLISAAMLLVAALGLCSTVGCPLRHSSQPATSECQGRGRFWKCSRHWLSLQRGGWKLSGSPLVRIFLVTRETLLIEKATWGAVFLTGSFKAKAK